MTFKHNNFEDSATMRSLTKLAREKGLIKDEPVVKTAAPKVDLTPSDSLTENLLKLCAGLRAAGFDKHAEEVETKFVQYKQATSMYGVGTEKGEDLVHAAHPKGSHKMEDIDSKEATFEDILDKHTQILDAVNKKPTGKLGSTQEVLDAVKKVFSTAKVVNADQNLDSLYAQAKSVLGKFRQIFNSIGQKLGSDLTSNNRWLDTIQTVLDHKAVYDHPGFMTTEELGNALDLALSSLKGDEEPSFFANSQETDDWKYKILPMFVIAEKYVPSFQKIIAQIAETEAGAKTQSAQQYDPDAQPEAQSEEQPESPLHPLFQQIDGLQLKLKSWLAVRSIAQHSGAAKWVNDEYDALQDIVDRYAKVDPTQQANLTETMKQEIDNEVKDISVFENQWVKPRA
jgi:hypothetical protein